MQTLKSVVVCVKQMTCLLLFKNRGKRGGKGANNENKKRTERRYNTVKCNGASQSSLRKNRAINHRGIWKWIKINVSQFVLQKKYETLKSKSKTYGIEQLSLYVRKKSVDG